MSSSVDPWVPHGLVAAVLAVVTASALRDDDYGIAAVTAAAALYLALAALRTYRRHQADPKDAHDGSERPRQDSNLRPSD